jgi:hypothetical protein
MASGYHVKPTKQIIQSDKIIPTNVKERDIIFNLKYLCENQKEGLIYSNKDTNYFIKILERLKEYSAWTLKRLNGYEGQRARCHAIDFVKDNLCVRTFGLGSQQYDQTAWQLCISKANGRIHGFFVDNIFHVVWFDPEHKLYPWKD